MNKLARLLYAQHTWGRVLVALVAVSAFSMASVPQVLRLLVLWVAYVFPLPKLYRMWAKSILIVTPFFSAYLLFVLLYGLPASQAWLFGVQIVGLLGVSVYLMGSAGISQLLANSRLDWPPVRHFCAFVVALSLFWPVLKQNLGHSTGNWLNRFVAATGQAFAQLDTIEQKVQQRLQGAIIRRRFQLAPNIYLLLGLVANVVIICN